MKQILMGCLAAVAVTAVATMARANESTMSFVQKASVSNMFEVQSSKLALQKAHNANVRALAEQMIADHDQVGEEMREAVAEAKEESELNLRPEMVLDKRHRQLMERLQAAPEGEAFEREYLAIQTLAHKQAIELFQDYAEHGANDAIENFAEETLPDLKEHLKQVQTLAANYQEGDYQ